MSSNGATSGGFAPADVMTALATLQSSDRSAKVQAHTFLENFQKSVRTRLEYLILCSDYAQKYANMLSLYLSKKPGLFPLICFDLMRKQMPNTSLPSRSKERSVELLLFLKKIQIAKNFYMV